MNYYSTNSYIAHHNQNSKQDYHKKVPYILIVVIISCHWSHRYLDNTPQNTNKIFIQPPHTHTQVLILQTSLNI